MNTTQLTHATRSDDPKKHTPGMPVRILVVDDDVAIQAVASQSLKSKNVHVVLASGGLQAMAVMKEQPVDLVLLDANMPDLDGFETCRILRNTAEFSDIPIIMATGRDDHESIERAFLEGADDFLIKPVSWSILKQRIHKYITDHKPVVALSNHQSRLGKKLQFDHTHTGKAHFIEQVNSSIEQSNRDSSRTVVVRVVISTTTAVRIEDNKLFSSEVESRLKFLNDSLLNEKYSIKKIRAGKVGESEYAICLSGGITDSVIDEINDCCKNTLAKAIDANGRLYTVIINIGFSSSVNGTKTAEAIFHEAGIACNYSLTNPLSSNTHRYSAKMQETIDREARIEYLLQQDIASHSLTLKFQPKVCSSSRDVVGVEALVRWTSEELGIVSPSEFIPVAEKSDLIFALTNFVMLETMRWAKQLSLFSKKRIPFSFNASPKIIMQADFVDQIIMNLEATGLNPALLEVEITENLMMDSTSLAIANLTRLRGIGSKVAIDDFGTGYSSLSYLNKIPADTLKIDRSFITPLGISSTASQVVQALIQVGHTVGLQVVAEGIETSAQFDVLSEMNCDVIQGFLTGRPMGFDQLQRLVCH